MRSCVVRAVMTALALLVASWSVRPAAAQVLVVPEQNLDFGSLTPGVPVTVTPTDVLRRGNLTVQGRGRFSLTFQLPAALVSTTGATIPLTFGATDGRVEVRHKVDAFDPRAGTTVRINPADQQASIFLGGRAQPAAGQPAGSYQATITVMIVQTGN